MPMPYMNPAEQAAAILNGIRIDQIEQCIRHVIQQCTNMACQTMNYGTQCMLTTGWYTPLPQPVTFIPHPLETVRVIRGECRLRPSWSCLNPSIGVLDSLQYVQNMRGSVGNLTIYANRVCCFAACEDVDDMASMWSLISFGILVLSIFSSDETTREGLSKYAFDPLKYRANAEKFGNACFDPIAEIQGGTATRILPPIAESGAKLLLYYLDGTASTTSCGFTGSFLAEAIVFNSMLLSLFGKDCTPMIWKNLELITASLQVAFYSGPGFVDHQTLTQGGQAASKSIGIYTNGVVVGDTVICDKFDDMVDEGAKMMCQGTSVEHFICKLYVVGDPSGRSSMGLLVSSSPHWDGTSFSFNSARFDDGCFYTVSFRRRLVVTDDDDQKITLSADGSDVCHFPVITSKIVLKGPGSMEFDRTIGQPTTVPITAIIAEYFATILATKKHAVGTIPVVAGFDGSPAGGRGGTTSGGYPKAVVVPGHAILKACDRENSDLTYDIGGFRYVSTARGIIYPYRSEADASRRLKIDASAHYKIVVEDGLVDEVSRGLANTTIDSSSSSSTSPPPPPPDPCDLTQPPCLQQSATSKPTTSNNTCDPQPPRDSYGTQPPRGLDTMTNNRSDPPRDSSYGLDPTTSNKTSDPPQNSYLTEPRYLETTTINRSDPPRDSYGFDTTTTINRSNPPHDSYATQPRDLGTTTINSRSVPPRDSYVTQESRGTDTTRFDTSVPPRNSYVPQPHGTDTTTFDTSVPPRNSYVTQPLVSLGSTTTDRSDQPRNTYVTQPRTKLDNTTIDRSNQHRDSYTAQPLSLQPTTIDRSYQPRDSYVTQPRTSLDNTTIDRSYQPRDSYVNQPLSLQPTTIDRNDPPRDSYVTQPPNLDTSTTNDRSHQPRDPYVTQPRRSLY